MKWIVGAHTHGCWVGTYEVRRQQALKRLVRPGMNLYDVGANAGFFALLASRLAGPKGRVVCFEPLRENLDLLRQHLTLNACANVTVIETAVAEIEGQLMMRSASRATAHLDPGGDMLVAVVTIDQCVLRRGLPEPAVIKIDVEGAEARVLRGAEQTLTKYHPTILLSTHSAALRAECQEFLRAHGYMLEPEDAGVAIEDSDEIIARFPTKTSVCDATAEGPSLDKR